MTLTYTEAFRIWQTCVQANPGLHIFVRDNSGAYFTFGSTAGTAGTVLHMAKEKATNEARTLEESMCLTWDFSQMNFGAVRQIAAAKLYDDAGRDAVFMLANASYSVTVMNGEPTN